jgi:hypothetical protein
MLAQTRAGAPPVTPQHAGVLYNKYDFNGKG